MRAPAATTIVDADEEEARLMFGDANANDDDDVDFEAASTITTTHTYNLEPATRRVGTSMGMVTLSLVFFSFVFAVGTWVATEDSARDARLEPPPPITITVPVYTNGPIELQITDRLQSRAPTKSMTTNIDDDDDAVPLPLFPSHVNCLPSVCTTTDKHFINTPSFILLNTFPGSGGTLMRSTIEAGTRVYTGSQFDNIALFRAGFRGELVDAFAKDTSPVIVIQAHHPHFRLKTTTKAAAATAVVLLMKNPLDAILSDFVHTKPRIDTSTPAPPVGDDDMLPPIDQQQRFADSFAARASKWAHYSRFWFGEDWRKRLSGITHNRGVMSLELFKRIASSSGGGSSSPPSPPVPVLVVFYEHLFMDWLECTGRVFQFVSEQMAPGELDLTVEDAVRCASPVALAGEEEEEKKEDEQVSYAGMEAQVAAACEEWRGVWFEEVWGKCGKVSATKTTTPHKNLPPPCDGDDE